MKSKENRLKEIASELHDIANEYAGDETGFIAVELHGVGSKIHQLLEKLNTGITREDKVNQLKEWLRKQPYPTDPGLAEYLIKE